MSAQPVTYRLEYANRPWTTNGERASNRWERAKLVKEWRGVFYWLAKQQQIPALDHADITVEVFQKNGRLQDVAAANPAVKAAIDGLVDAGVFPDDSSQFVRSIKFLAPQRGKNALILHLEGQASDSSTQPKLVSTPLGETT